MAKQPCAQSGCSELVQSGRCAQHATQHRRWRERWRGSAASRGYDAAWQRVRGFALRRDNYLCQLCLAAGRVTPAQDVHHRRKVVRAPELRLDLENLVSVCRECHDRAEKDADG